MALVGLSVWFELVHQTAKLTRIVAEARPASGMSLAVAASTASKLLADGCHCRRGLDPQQTRGSVPRRVPGRHDRNLAISAHPALFSSPWTTAQPSSKRAPASLPAFAGTAAPAAIYALLAQRWRTPISVGRALAVWLAATLLTTRGAWCVRLDAKASARAAASSPPCRCQRPLRCHAGGFQRW